MKYQQGSDEFDRALKITCNPKTKKILAYESFYWEKGTNGAFLYRDHIQYFLYHGKCEVVLHDLLNGKKYTETFYSHLHQNPFLDARRAYYQCDEGQPPEITQNFSFALYI